MSGVPHSFLFRYSVPVSQVKPGPKASDLPAKAKLPHPGELDTSEADDRQPFAELRAGWNEKGLLFKAVVERDPKTALVYAADVPEKSDSLSLWIDTRNTQTIHRASRFCHHFVIYSTGGGKVESDPIVQPRAISRAREEVTLPDAKLITAKRKDTKTGYELRVDIPTAALTGFDVEVSDKLGFFYHLHDRTRGDQFFSIDGDFPFASDPSLWSTLELLQDG